MVDKTIISYDHIRQTFINKCNNLVDKMKEKMLKNIGTITLADFEDDIPNLTGNDFDNSVDKESKKLLTQKKDVLVQIESIKSSINDFRYKTFNDINDNLLLDVYHKCTSHFSRIEHSGLKIKEEIFIRLCFKKSLRLLLKFIEKQEQEKHENQI